MYAIRSYYALFIGGNFWDGRATGEVLGSPAAEQALGPFLNPLEQALPSAAGVVTRICASTYVSLFTQVCGSDACDRITSYNVCYTKLLRACLIAGKSFNINHGSASGSGVPPGLQIQCCLPKAGRVGSIPTRNNFV